MCTEHHYWHHDYVRLAFDSGFCFDSNKSKSNVDRCSLSIIDIEAVVKDRDVAVIEKHLNTIINYYLEPEHTKILDPTFVKVFRLSQLSVEYLQFCKRYLDNTVVVIKRELAQFKEENNNLKDYTEELKSEINDLKEKIKTLKQSLEQQASIENNHAYKCPTCLKVFVTEDYLLSHIKRRHETISFQSETDKLQLEIKELKERLNTTEKYIKSDSNLKITDTVPDNNQALNNQPTIIDKLERVDLLLTKFEELKQFVERELSLLKAENCNDKYEKWLEIVFKRLDNSKKELQSEKYGDGDVLSTGDGFSEKKTADNVTQTGIIERKDIEIMTDTFQDVNENKSKQQLNEIEIDIKKLQEELYVNTENHLGQIQNALEEKLTGGLELIQTQINTFYDKINKLEAEKIAQFKAKEFSSPIKTYKIEEIEKIEKSENLNEMEGHPRPLPRSTKSLPFIKEKKSLSSKRSAPKLENKPFTNNKTKTVACGLTSIVSSLSSISEDEKVLLPTKENVIFKHKPIGKKKDVQKSLEVKTLYDKNIKIGTMFCESNDSDEEQDKVPVKPSTSTLGRRSISSLKQVVKDKQVLDGLKNELEEMLCLRLKGVGVSPVWKRLPKKSYLKAMKIVQHQTELTTKKYPDYYKIREKLLKKINKTLKKTTKKTITTKPQIIEKQEKSKVLIKKSKPQIEPKKANRLIFDSEDESSSNKTFVTAPKEPQQETVETIDAKMGKKKVLFDLEESSSIVKDKLKDKDKISDKIQTLMVVRSKNNEEIVADKVQVFTNKKPEKDDSGGSSGSVTSSILDAAKPETSQNNDRKGGLRKDEISDWDISDIS